MVESLHRGAFRAPGKMFWIGEYSVLFGGPALVAAVDRYALAEYRTHPPRANGTLRVESSHSATPFYWRSGSAAPHAHDDWSLVRSVLHTLLNELPGFEVPHGVISLDSGALQSDTKLGLGSSGAIAVLTVAALTACHPIPRDQVEKLALKAHHHFQGRAGSGGDVIASTRGGLTRLQDQSRDAVRVPSSLFCGALYTGVSASTPALVSKMKAAAELDEHVRALLDDLAAISNRAILSLRSGLIGEWMACVREFHAAEAELTRAATVGIVTKEVQACVDLAARFGCSAKASGAGGGDVVVVFADAPDALQSLKSASDAAGFPFIDLHLDHDGLMPVQLRESLPEP